MSKKVLFILFLISLLFSNGYAEIVNLKTSGSVISLQVRDEKLDSILRMLSKNFSFKYTVPPTLAQKTITTNINNKPLDRVIKRVLSLINGNNYTIIYSKNGDIKMVKIFERTTHLPKRQLSSKRKYSRGVINRRPVRRRPVTIPPPIYSTPPDLYNEDLFDDNELYYPEFQGEIQYPPQRRSPYIPFQERE